MPERLDTSSAQPGSNVLRAVVRLLSLLLVSLFLLPLCTVLVGLAALFGPAVRSRVVVILTPIVLGLFALALWLRVRVIGRRDPEARLFVGNHVSYMDIVTAGIGAAGVFVSRHDVRDWPIIGLFARLAGTVFLDRRSLRSAIASADAMAVRLEHGARVILFPEGGTSSGETVEQFKPFLFGGVVERGVAVQPFTIRYTHLGRTPITPALRPLVAWYDPAPPFHIHAWQLLKLPPLRAEFIFHSTERPAPSTNRDDVRRFSEEMWSAVKGGLHATRHTQ